MPQNRDENHTQRMTSKMLQKGSNLLQNGAQMGALKIHSPPPFPPRWPYGHPRVPQGRPKSSQGHILEPQSPPKGAQGTTLEPQGPPKGAQDPPKGTPWAPCSSFLGALGTLLRPNVPKP